MCKKSFSPIKTLKVRIFLSDEVTLLMFRIFNNQKWIFRISSIRLRPRRWKSCSSLDLFKMRISVDRLFHKTLTDIPRDSHYRKLINRISSLCCIRRSTKIFCERFIRFECNWSLKYQGAHPLGISRCGTETSHCRFCFRLL